MIIMMLISFNMVIFIPTENCRQDCFQPEPYFNSSSVNLFTYDYKTNSMIFDLFMLIISGIGFAGVLFSLEYVLPQIRTRREIEKNTDQSATPPATSGSFLTTYGTGLDEDVEDEAARVENIVKDDALETANHALISHNLKMEFGKLKAVDGLSFGVNRGECFGKGLKSTFKL